MSVLLAPPLSLVVFSFLLVLAGLFLRREACVYRECLKERYLVLPLLLTMVLGFGLVFCTTHGDLISDEIEYLSLAHELIQSGKAEIRVGSTRHPSRYPPWLSAYVFAPSLLIFGGVFEYLRFTLAILSGLSLYLGFLLGRRIGCGLSGTLAVLLVIVLPEFRYFSLHLMSDVAFSALVLAAGLCYLRAQRAETGRGDVLISGLVVSAAFLVKPLGVLLAIPFVLSLTKRSFGKLLTYILPVCCGVLLHLLYQWDSFGTFWRSGYHYWLPIPYDYFGLTFHHSYAAKQLKLLLFESSLLPLSLGCMALHFFCRGEDKSRNGLAALLTFSLLFGAPYLLIHVFYFYPTTRFFLPLEILSAVILACYTFFLIPKTFRRSAQWASIAGSVGIVVLCAQSRASSEGNLSLEYQLPPSVKSAELIVSDLNHAFLSRLVPGERLIPWSRREEYASKMISNTKIELRTRPQGPFTHNPFTHRSIELANAGAQEVFPFVAIEDVSALESRLNAGERIVIHHDSVTPAEEEMLKERFDLGDIEDASDWKILISKQGGQ